MALTDRLARLTPRRIAALVVIGFVLAGTAIAVTTSDDDKGATRSSDLMATDDAGGGGVAFDEERVIGEGKIEPSFDGGVQGSSGAGSSGAGPTRQIAPSPPSAASPLDTVTGGDGGSSFLVPGAQKVVRTAELRVEVTADGFDAAFDRAAGIAAANGGFVAGSSTSSFVPPDGITTERRPEDRSARSGELTLRVPADRFDAVRQALAGLGKVESQSIRGEDVSGQLVDFEARLRSLGAQEEALRTLLGKAVAVGEVIQVQSQLFSVRQQIEQLEAQRADLDQRASLSTISVSLFEPGAAFAPFPKPATGLARSFERAVEGAVAVVGGMIVAVGWSLPLAGIGLLVWLVVRLRRRAARPATS